MTRNFRFTLKAVASTTAVVLGMAAPAAHATDSYLTSIAITRIRTVGDYQGTTFDNTTEIWFNGPVNYGAGSRCASAFRVFVDVKHKHIVSAALLALSTSRKVNINVDDTLPIRDGACEVTFLDIDP